jgi:hypothetical protein
MKCGSCGAVLESTEGRVNASEDQVGGVSQTDAHYREDVCLRCNRLKAAPN